MKHGLILRFTLTNIIAISLLAIAWVQGYIQAIFSADQTHLTVIIFGLFLYGLALSAYRCLGISHALDAGSTPLSDIELKQKIAPVQDHANNLVLLGLIGTVLGFIIAMSGVDPETVSDVDSMAPMVSTLIQGMSTAMYTTLVGSVLNLWLMTNYRLLAAGTVGLIADRSGETFADYLVRRQSGHWQGLGK